MNYNHLRENMCYFFILIFSELHLPAIQLPHAMQAGNLQWSDEDQTFYHRICSGENRKPRNDYSIFWHSCDTFLALLMTKESVFKSFIMLSQRLLFTFKSIKFRVLKAKKVLVTWHSVFTYISYCITGLLPKHLRDHSQASLDAVVFDFRWTSATWFVVWSWNWKRLDSRCREGSFQKTIFELENTIFLSLFVFLFNFHSYLV